MIKIRGMVPAGGIRHRSPLHRRTCGEQRLERQRIRLQRMNPQTHLLPIFEVSICTARLVLCKRCVGGENSRRKGWTYPTSSEAWWTQCSECFGVVVRILEYA